MRNRIKRMVFMMAAALFPIMGGCAGHSPVKAPAEESARQISQEDFQQTDNSFYFFVESQFMKKKGDFAAALKSLQSAVESDPESLYLKRELAQLYWQNKDFPSAMAVAKELMQSDPDDAENLILYARISQILKNMDEAKTAYEKVLALDPENKGIYLLLGGIYMDEGNPEFALQIYRKMVQQFPDHFAGYFVLGQTYAEMGNFREAEKSYLKSLELEPELDDARYKLIDLYQNYSIGDVQVTIRPGDTINRISLKLYNRYDNAVQKAVRSANPGLKNLSDLHVGQKIVFPQLYSSDETALIGHKAKIINYYKDILESAPEDIRAAMGLGYFLHETGKRKEAESIFRQLGRRSGTDHDVIDAVLRYYLDEKNFNASVIILENMADGASEKSEIKYITAFAYQGRGEPSKAVKVLLEIPPDSAFYEKAVEFLYYLYDQEEKPSEAAAYLNRAIEARPEITNFRLYLGKLYEDMEEYDKAIATLREGLEKDPENAKLYFMLGVIYDKLGNREDAIAMIKEVLRLSPEDPTALNYLGYTYADMGQNLDEAQSLIEQAMQYKPNDGYITDSLGWVLFQKGDYRKAVEVLRQAMNLVPDDPTILEHMGDVYYKLNDEGKALEMYERSLLNAPDDEEKINQKIREIKDELE